MPLLTWTAQYATGNRDIDAQHQHLIELVNEIHEHMLRSDRADTLHPLLNTLTRFLNAHFAMEERYMQACRFPGYAEQRREHAALSQQLQEFAAELRARKDGASLQLSTFLKYAMHDHMAVADQAYARYWRSHGSRPELRMHR